MTKSSIIPAFVFLSFLLLENSCALIKTQSGEELTTKTLSSVFPKAIGFINDYENILTDQEERDLADILKKLEALKTDQMAIVTVREIEPYTNIDDYSFDLANYWRIGQKGKNNGILIALSKELRVIRIQNGMGIERRLSDMETKQIIDNIMIPAFKENQYYLGLKKGVEAMIKELSN